GYHVVADKPDRAAPVAPNLEAGVARIVARDEVPDVAGDGLDGLCDRGSARLWNGRKDRDEAANGGTVELRPCHPVAEAVVSVLFAPKALERVQAACRPGAVAARNRVFAERVGQV